MAKLRRTMAGGFTLEDATPLGWLECRRDRLDEPDVEAAAAAKVRPLEHIACALPAVWIPDGALQPLATGSPLYRPGVVACSDGIEAGQRVALHRLNGDLIALADAAACSTEMLQGRGVAARPRVVLVSA
jgi:tRNA U55 pseudouridine synthase TruB